MAVDHVCPLCGSKMFHDKGNHITFCGKCDHVGWPHDAQKFAKEENKEENKENKDK